MSEEFTSDEINIVEPTLLQVQADHQAQQAGH